MRPVYPLLRDFLAAHAAGDTKGARLQTVYWSVNGSIEIRTRGGLVLYRAACGLTFMYDFAEAMGFDGVTA